MLKRVLCVIFSVLLAMTVCVCAAAGDAESRAVAAAPDGLRFVFTYPNEGSECIEAIFSVPYDACALASDADRYACLVQFDWSVDSRDAFHADENWDKVGGNYPVQQLSGSFLEKKEVLWFAYPEAAERCAGALRETEKDGATVRTFDFDAHKLYVRARFMAYAYASGECRFSDWSDAFDVGADKGAKALKVSGVGEDRPSVTNAEFADGVLSYTVAYPDSVRQTAYALLCTYGESLNFESQIRVDGGVWQYWVTENDALPYLTGTRKVGIAEFSDAQTVEYRCRLTANNPDDGVPIITGWSDYVTVKNGAVEIVENDDPFGAIAEAKRIAEAEKEANKCKLCGICPFHPFGICMFLWLAVILLIVLVIVYNVYASRKKKKRVAETKAREEAARRSAPDKTGSFVQTDRITLQKKDDSEPEADASEEDAPQADEQTQNEPQEDETDES